MRAQARLDQTSISGGPLRLRAGQSGPQREASSSQTYGVRSAEPLTQLHVHSHYTLLGGTASVSDLARRAAEDGMSHLALTDTDALYGVVSFARACAEAGVQPIIGMAASVALPDDLQEGLSLAGPPGLVVLLARDHSGYRSLCRLSSVLQGHPDREARLARGLRVDDLGACAEGVLCLDGGRRGWTERLLRAGRPQAARRYAGRLAHLYGPHAFLSLELHRPEDAQVAEELSSLSGLLGIPAVAAQPVYCLSRHDVPRLELLAAIDRNCPLDELPPAALPGGGDPAIDLHWLGADEMRARYAAFPDALARVAEVAASCGEALPDGKPIFPVLDLPEGQSPEDALANLARAGVHAHYGAQPHAEVGLRLERELSAIAGHGYAPLFLIVADIVRFAHEHDIPVSTRGSVANSLVAYCTGITTVDPVANELLFERFLSPARVGAASPMRPISTSISAHAAVTRCSATSITSTARTASAWLPRSAPCSAAPPCVRPPRPIAWRKPRSTSSRSSSRADGIPIRGAATYGRWRTSSIKSTTRSRAVCSARHGPSSARRITSASIPAASSSRPAR